MANEMRQVFGDALLTERVDEAEATLPSPEVLRGKILVKHGKLPDSVGGDKPIDSYSEDLSQEMDLRSTIKSGILYVEDDIDRQWNPHFFVLTEQKLYYTDTFAPSVEMNQDEDEESLIQRPIEVGVTLTSLIQTLMNLLFNSDLSHITHFTLHFFSSDIHAYISSSIRKYAVLDLFCPPSQGVARDELHYGETWFHGLLENDRLGAEELLARYSHLEDGTFLVRQSGTFVGDFCLSFWHRGRTNHCRIKLKQDMGHTKYYFIESQCFDSLYSLVTYYRSHPIRSSVIISTCHSTYYFKLYQLSSNGFGFVFFCLHMNSRVENVQMLSSVTINIDIIHCLRNSY